MISIITITVDLIVFGENVMLVLIGKYEVRQTVDYHMSYYHSSRYTCLQVRCPGETVDGEVFDVDVSITVQTPSGTCNIS